MKLLNIEFKINFLFYNQALENLNQCWRFHKEGMTAGVERGPMIANRELAIEREVRKTFQIVIQIDQKM